MERILYGSQLKERLEQRTYDSLDVFLREYKEPKENQLSLKKLIQEDEKGYEILDRKGVLDSIQLNERYRINGSNIRKSNLDCSIRMKEYENLDSSEVLVEFEFYLNDSYGITVPYLFDSQFDVSMWKNKHRHAFNAEFDWNDASYCIKVDAYIDSIKTNLMLVYNNQDISYKTCEVDLSNHSDWESSARDWLGDLGMNPKSIIIK